MNELYSASRRLWWLVLVRGIVAVLLGLFALFSPSTTVLVLVTVFGVYALVDGVSAIGMALGSRRELSRWGWVLFEGVVSVLAGLVAILWPVFSAAVTAVVIGFIIGFWAALLGVLQISQSITLRRQPSPVWGWVLASGILTLLWGIFVLAVPGIGLLTVLWIFSLFALVFGAWTIALSLRIRSGVNAAADSAPGR
ncbi:HdeD family acid-resistance protein [Psychromicrobium xiongbiense]|uniref:HdeD family acid-resistance protein n=1 Tax=Psychromicrobium xiongbiense TaxID=3051184 RepID=UPI0025533315|nr:HdeD family acid-resistance protein [Psychromicrobium sp. YIM S02556]